MAQTEAKVRPPSYTDDEDIEVKPSTELIPDEYQRTGNENMLVPMFFKHTDDDAEEFCEVLGRLGFHVDVTHPPDKITGEWIEEIVNKICERTKEKEVDGLLMIFANLPLQKEMLKRIWCQFTSLKCPALKNKPKIFVFQVSRRTVSVDYTRIDPIIAYDTPSEADILVIYNKISTDDQSYFLWDLTKNIEKYASSEDLASLITISSHCQVRPLLISTMTRKFFFNHHEHRGHHHTVTKKHIEIKEHLEKVQTLITTLTEQQSKPRDKGVLRNLHKSIQKSFRSNNEHKEKTQKKVTKKDKSKEKILNSSIKETPGTSQVSQPKPKTPTRKTSVDGPTTSRTRKPSTSFCSSKEEIKPPWK